jgi:hypothetical protein
MPKEPDIIFSLDAEAIRTGGEKAGLYLDMLGKTDLSTMTAEEWKTFCTHLVEGAWRYGLDRHVERWESRVPADAPKPLTDAEIPH